MSGDRLPQGCLSPKKTAGIDGGPARWIVRCHDFTARGQTKEDAISEAWLKWESYLKRITGQTRAEYEQRERALAFVKMMAETIMELEIPDDFRAVRNQAISILAKEPTDG